MDCDAVTALLLRVASSATVTNQYRQDGPGSLSASGRLARVEQHLLARGAGSFVVVGEAAGWRGARQTGLAFTSPLQLTGAGMAEASATAVRGVLAEQGALEDALLWNAFPWHPHPVLSHEANRTPTVRETREGLPLLRLVIADRPVLAVGRRAAAAVEMCLGRPVPEATSGRHARALSVRHPSFGGLRQFLAGAREAVPRLRAAARS